MNFVSLYFESAGSVGRRSGAVKLGDSRGMANNAPMRERAQRQTPIYRQSQSKSDWLFSTQRSVRAWLRVVSRSVIMCETAGTERGVDISQETVRSSPLAFGYAAQCADGPIRTFNWPGP